MLGIERAAKPSGEHVQLAPNSTALAFDSARRRAAAACGRRNWSASGAASDVGDLRRPTHRLATREGGMGASATNCRHTPACVRVRAQVPCLYGAALQWWPALSRLCGARCSQTWCGATFAAVHSSRRPTRTPASPGCVLSRARSFARAPCPQRTLPHTRPARAALRRPRRRSDRRPVLSVVRRLLAQVLRLVAEGAVSASRSAARAPGAPQLVRCGRRRGAVGGVSDQDPRRVGLSLGARNTSVHTGQ